MNNSTFWYNQHWWYWNVFWPKEQERLLALKKRMGNEKDYRRDNDNT